jgi:hypothetical protein
MILIYLLKGFIMTYTVTKNVELAAELSKAAAAITSAFATIKTTAAEICKAEIKRKGATAETKVKAIIQAYATEYDQLDTNGKTTFRNACYVVLNASVVVELPAPKASAKAKAEGKTSGTVKVKAGEALEKASKHVLVDIAKQIREAKGEANAKGGGAPKTAAGATATIKSGAEMAVSFRATLEALLGSEKGRKELEKILKDNGYRLEAVKVQGKAKPAAAKLGALVNQQLKANEAQRIAA